MRINAHRLEIGLLVGEKGDSQMKKVALVLFATMVLTNLSVNSYALDFRGLRLGMTTDEVCKWIEKTAVSGQCNPNQTGDVQNWAERRLVGDGVDYATVLIIDNKVQKITISIYQDSSEGYRQALHKKYGKPVSSKQVPYMNNFGVKFMGLKEYWKVGKDHLWFIGQPSSVSQVDTLLIFETDEWVQLENKKPEPKL